MADGEGDSRVKGSIDMGLWKNGAYAIDSLALGLLHGVAHVLPLPGVSGPPSDAGGHEGGASRPGPKGPGFEACP
jgi:hypothetical protein